MPICTVRIGACIKPAKPGERGAEPEHQRVEQLDVDAERAHHLAVGGAGADQHAEPRAHDQDIEQRRDRQRHTRMMTRR